MKIEYIVAARMPTEKAHGLQIAKMCEAFVQSGHEIQLIVPHRKNDIRDPIGVYYGLKKEFPIRYLFVPDVLGVFGFLGPLVYRMYIVLFLVRLLFYQPREGSVIYTRTAEVAWLFKQRGYRVICEVHDWPESYENIFRFLLKKVDLLPCNSEGTAEVCRAHGLMQTMVAHNGVSLEDFSIEIDKDNVRAKLDIPKEKFVVMYIGALEKWKGVGTLLQASKMLSEEYRVVIIGGKKEEVEVFKKEYPAVQFLGYRPYTELARNQKTADLLVIPNTPVSIESERYTSPIKLFAYMASRVPIAASDMPSIRAIIDDSTAYFFKAGDAGDLAFQIQEISKDMTNARAKAEEACRRVEAYTWRSRAENIIVQLNAARV